MDRLLLDEPIANISENTDYCKVAQDFMKTVLPSNFQDIFAKMIKDNEFNKNEAQLIKKFCEDSVNFELTLSMLKHIL